MKEILKPKLRMRTHWHNPLEYQTYFFALRVVDEHAKALEDKFEILHMDEVYEKQKNCINTEDNTYYYGYIDATSMWNAVDASRKLVRQHIYDVFMKTFT